jgi:hypothetical protein
MIVTFIDSGLLIAAARGIPEASARALAILDDPERAFASSEFVRLEVLPKAVFNRKSDEAEFYQQFLAQFRIGQQIMMLSCDMPMS